MIMEVPLSPLAFARRARRLCPNREAVVDGADRWAYEAFFDRCDRWSTGLQKLGVIKGDRVAYISPNTHSKLEAYYAVPQIGAVVVPINYRLTAEDFAYIINHSDSRVVCAHADYLEMIDSIRDELNSVTNFISLSESRDGWFHSGDVAVVHSDGYIDVRDRSKDVIISGGENISSVEVEGALLHHPSVQEVAVVGMPHEKWGESPHAFVVLTSGAKAEEEELRQFVRQRLAHFKTPQWITFVEELPKTATGKVQKFVLRGNRSGISKQ